MIKKKSQSKTRTWSFVVSLPLNECIRRLETWNEPRISVKTNHPNDDSASFELDYKQPFKVTLHVAGTLSIWEGTHTKVDMELSLLAKTYNLLYGIPLLFYWLCSGIAGFAEVSDISTSLVVVACCSGILFIGSSLLWLIAPDNVTDSDMKKIRLLLINQLCQGESGLQHYLIVESEVGSS